MIADVKVKTLKVIPDERGRLMEILRTDDEVFRKFGQIYLTVAYPGVVKGWHYHKVQYDNFACVSGMIKLVLYDARENSQTYKKIDEFFMGLHNPILVQIPPYVYHGFKAIGTQEGLMINLSTELYYYKEPDEFRLSPHSKEIPYDWSKVDG
ncbi:MAG: dTDP-4-dehydrorhamnose 3,5-epimerase family protein [Candidatus Omnitrophica bacterium]|nr:dTDP-4-dehydrorhamnose 3,5-epimerase family protein [Candidatus Omnitrophota bacterium]